MAPKRPYTKYQVVKDRRVLHGGITTKFEERKATHERDYPGATVRRVGGPCTEKGARQWEKDNGYS